MSQSDPVTLPSSSGVCWILLGMMGAGKSTVGKFLAERTSRPFADVDSMLQHRFGRPVHQIFRVYGEEAFRGHETSVLKSLEPSPFILATGGGIVTREENWTEMGRLGITMYLSAELATLQERLRASAKRRPLLEVEDWEGRLEELLEKRLPLYQRANLTLDVSECGLDAAAEKARQLFEAFEAKSAEGASR